MAADAPKLEARAAQLTQQLQQEEKVGTWNIFNPSHARHRQLNTSWHLLAEPAIMLMSHEFCAVLYRVLLWLGRQRGFREALTFLTQLCAIGYVKPWHMRRSWRGCRRA